MLDLAWTRTMQLVFVFRRNYVILLRSIVLLTKHVLSEETSTIIRCERLVDVTLVHFNGATIKISTNLALKLGPLCVPYAEKLFPQFCKYRRNNLIQNLHYLWRNRLNVQKFLIKVSSGVKRKGSTETAHWMWLNWYLKWVAHKLQQKPIPDFQGYTPLFTSVKRLPVKVYHNCSP